MKTDFHRLKTQLQLTPRRVAIQYIDSLHLPQSVEDPDPLAALLQTMKSEIESRMPPQQADRVYTHGRKHVCYLVNLYILTMVSVFNEICSSLELITLAFASSRFRPIVSPPLCLRLADAENALQIRCVLIDILREKHFRGASIGPPWLGDQLLALHTQLLFACGLTNLCKLPDHRLLGQDACLREARTMLTALESNAGAAASLDDCGVSAYFLRVTEARTIKQLQNHLRVTCALLEELRCEIDGLLHRARAAQKTRNRKRKPKPGRRRPPDPTT